MLTVLLGRLVVWGETENVIFVKQIIERFKLPYSLLGSSWCALSNRNHREIPSGNGPSRTSAMKVSPKLLTVGVRWIWIASLRDQFAPNIVRFSSIVNLIGVIQQQQKMRHKF